MLISHQYIEDRFLEHLSWATSNAGLRELNRRMPLPKLRAVVGLWGNLTDPRALTSLADLGELRIADASRRFHPKVFIFRDSRRSVAWVGSANFTSGGFGLNEEAVFETTDTQSVQDWFDALWNGCGPLEMSAIHEYSESRRANPPPPPPRPPMILASAPRQLLENIGRWSEYVAAVQQCDSWWGTRRPWSVLGDGNSWRETIEVLHDIVRQKDWDGLSDSDRLRMLGLAKKGCWALLGRMRPAARHAVFGNNLKTIRDTVLAVGTANDAEFPHAAFDAYERLVALEGMGAGSSTRLLALARPDRFVSLNNASRAGLADIYGLAPTTIDQPRNYRLLLEKIYDQGRFRKPTPKDAQERTIWWMRVALLDSFVYNDQ